MGYKKPGEEKDLFSPEKLLEFKAKDEKPVRLAVEEVLIPSLQGAALRFGQGIVERFGAYNLYATTEAVSGLLYRYLSRNPTRQIIMDNFGEVRVLGSFDLLFTVEHMAHEVAEFTDMWADKRKSVPDNSTLIMVHWVAMALEYQPNLLPDFVATVPEEIPYVFLLTKVDAKNRVDDPRQRWRRSPSKQS